MNRLPSLLVVAVFAIGMPFAAEALSYAGYPQVSYLDPWAYQSNPQVSWCGSYYGTCQIGTRHVFSPYTYVNIDPFTYTNVGLSGQGTYQYPTQTYTYPSQQTHSYSYPQYQSSYSVPDYYQPSYQPNYYQSYGYMSSPTYTPYYMQGDEYCYSGYGCYPLYVEDPHQWVYDQWTGTWY